MTFFKFVKTTTKIAEEQDTMQQVINLLDVIIWPIAMIVGLYMFKKHIGKIISSLGSIKAGTDGIELNFIEEKLNDATKLIGIGPGGITAKGGGSIKPKGGSSIKPKGGGSIKPKSGGSIFPEDNVKTVTKRSFAESPHQELLALQDTINQDLNNLASNHTLNVSGTSNFALVNDLANNEVLDAQTTRQLNTLIELIGHGFNSTKLTYNHVLQMKSLYNNISF